MNDKRNNPIENSPTFTFQNDIAALSKAFSIPKIDYVDISRQKHMNEVIRRWPLLAELMQFAGSAK
uniref:cellulose biosynthesis protein BcsR n=1 Tax=Hafnia alvei TaxID=569 RepID=UPI0026F1208D|nr:cellulose biosynthesis protein BcsR [Hafnia alvei]